MLKFLFYFLFSCLSLPFLCHSANLQPTVHLQSNKDPVPRRNAKKNLKVSVVIPCHAPHMRLIPNLLEIYAKQTVPPDEIVISMSGDDINRRNYIRDCKRVETPFPVKLYSRRTRAIASINRNIAGVHTTGDIIIYQDADDIPYPQRVEIIKWYFENYHVDHLMHRFTFMHNNSESENIENFDQIPKLFLKDYIGHSNWANNAVSISREVLNKVRWDAKKSWGEDVDFNSRVYRQFDNCIILDCALYKYFDRNK